MAATPIASLAACSWCGLLAERGPICEACGSPVAETTGRTTVLRLPEASQRFRQGLREPDAPAAVTAPTSSPATPTRRVARWLNVGQASVMSGVPERTLRGWASSRTPEDVPIAEGDPRFLLIRTPGLKPPDGMWMVDGPASPVIPAPAPSVLPASVTVTATASANVPVMPRPDLPVPSIPVADATTPPPPPRPQPPVRVPILTAPVHPRVPAAPVPPARREPALSDVYVAALLADDVLPETWGFDASPDERRIFRRHKILAAAGILLAFGGVAEAIDFLISHLH